VGMCAVPEAVCGNSFVETGEECDDGSNNADAKSCKSDCTRNLCGDGIIRTGMEQCDGSSLAGASCQTQGFANGTLSCSNSCTFDSTACVVAPPTPPNVTFTANGTKISLGEIVPTNNTFSTLLTATEGFSQKVMIYTIIYNAEGKVLKLETDELTTGMNKEAWVTITANHLQTEVKKKVVLVFDVEPNPTVYGQLERTYS